MFKYIFYLYCFNFIFCEETTSSQDTKLVIDNDAGGDDAMAIFLALLYEKKFNGPKVVGLTTTNGNAFEENVCINNQRILKVIGREDVPIYRGAKKSLIITPIPSFFYGKDGLGDNNENMTNLVPVQNKKAVDALLELSKIYEGNLVVITLGTVTNIALAITLDGSFLTRLKHLYVAAGHVESDIHPNAEFNARMDVEAYYIIAQAATPDKVTLFPYSQAIDSLSIDKKWRESVFGGIDSDIIRAQNNYERISMTKYEMWHSLDPAVVAIALNSNLIEEARYCKNSIILCGERRGINTNEFCEKDQANMRMIYAVKKEEYKKFILDVFKP